MTSSAQGIHAGCVYLMSLGGRPHTYRVTVGRKTMSVSNVIFGGKHAKTRDVITIDTTPPPCVILGQLPGSVCA